MRLLITICTFLTILTGCTKPVYHFVQIGTRAYTLPPGEMRLFAEQHGLVSPTYPAVMQGSALGGVMAYERGYEVIQEHADGCYLVKTDTILISAKDPYHLAQHERNALIHELAHREDCTRYGGVAGTSLLWVTLTQIPGGKDLLTHPAINEKLRQEGFLKSNEP